MRVGWRGFAPVVVAVGGGGVLMIFWATNGPVFFLRIVLSASCARKAKLDCGNKRNSLFFRKSCNFFLV